MWRKQKAQGKLTSVHCAGAEKRRDDALLFAQRPNKEGCSAPSQNGADAAGDPHEILSMALRGAGVRELHAAVT